MMSEKTPGQLNYEAHQVALIKRIPHVIDQKWDGWERAVKNDWETAAAAAVRAPLLELIDDMRCQLFDVQDSVSNDESNRIEKLIARANAELEATNDGK